MEKRKCLTFLFFLILCYSLFQYTARAQTSLHSISSQGKITYSTLNVNLAVIPDGWQMTYGRNPQIIFLDYNVVRTVGNPSIRLEPHTANDVNTGRECDGKWYSVKPGDHIVAKIWIYVPDVPAGYTPGQIGYNICGGRLGVDLNGGGYNLYSLPLGLAPEYNNYVEWGTSGWVQKSYDFIVPSDYFTKDLFTGNTILPTQISSFAIWVQALVAAYNANAWFADAELYINP